MKMLLTKDRTLGEQAQHWIRCLPNAGATERDAFARWLKRSPQHVHSYLRMLALEREYQDFDSSREIDVDQLIAQAGDNVVPLGLRGRRRKLSADSHARWRMTRRLAAATVAVALALFVAVYFSADWHLYGLQEYATRTGQQEQFKLSDGSIVNLNAETTVRVAVTANRRDVYLLNGEALFEVKHDPGRPFHVHVDGMTIEDIGTQFNVYSRSGPTQISVIEGEVKVFQESPSGAAPLMGSLLRREARVEADYVPLLKPTAIFAGRTVSVTPKGREIRETALDLQQATAWRQRLLVFHGNSLREIAAEFNRYNVIPKIEVNDAQIGNRAFSGIFRADDPKSFVAFLQQETDLAVDTQSGSLVITKR